MKIVINDKNEIVSYSKVGGVGTLKNDFLVPRTLTDIINEFVNKDDSKNETMIETNALFPSKFQNGKFIYDKDTDKIIDNPNYIADKTQIKNQIENEITQYKELLNNSDYKVLKYIEGCLEQNEYNEIKTQRQEWRNKINELEEMLK